MLKNGWEFFFKLALMLLPMCSLAYNQADVDWLELEVKIARARMFANIDPPGSLRGTVLASPQTAEPNYHFHWVRDSAIVYNSMIDLYQISDDPQFKQDLLEKLYNYVRVEREHQRLNGKRFGLGEPRFMPDGLLDDLTLVRPQNDGPALRAISIIRFANILMERGKIDFVRKNLFGADETVIKMDLDYISKHWREPSFDLWEQNLGDHFYNRMVQRRALRMGAKLAETFGDFNCSKTYRMDADQIEQGIQMFWDDKAKVILPTRNHIVGVDYKENDLDMAVILAVLHGYDDDEFFPPSDPRILSTLEQLIVQFRELYPINRDPKIPGTALGRYPKDRYDGITEKSEGNPWILTTLAGAEVSFLASREVGQTGSQAKADQLASQGWDFVARVKYHTKPDGFLYEQIDRNAGEMRSARDLSWSYAAVITTYLAWHNLERR